MDMNVLNARSVTSELPSLSVKAKLASKRKREGTPYLIRYIKRPTLLEDAKCRDRIKGRRKYKLQKQSIMKAMDQEKYQNSVKQKESKLLTKNFENYHMKQADEAQRCQNISLSQASSNQEKSRHYVYHKYRECDEDKSSKQKGIEDGSELYNSCLHKQNFAKRTKYVSAEYECDFWEPEIQMSEPMFQVENKNDTLKYFSKNEDGKISVQKISAGASVVGIKEPRSLKNLSNRSKQPAFSNVLREMPDAFSEEAERKRIFLKRYIECVNKCQSQHDANPYEKAAAILQNEWKRFSMKRVGRVPGVNVGDIFHHRIMLRMVGLHIPTQAGIDYLRSKEGTLIATSIVLSGRYEDNIDNGDVVIYTGHGGNDYLGSNKQIEDQTATPANIALKNSCRLKYPVRLIRSCASNVENVPSGSYRYDGPYQVEEAYIARGRSGFKVFKFRLKLQEGQPRAAFPIVQFAHGLHGKNSSRTLVLKQDISEGIESFPIPTVNSLDSAQFYTNFRYISEVIYPTWMNNLPPRKGCACQGSCSTGQNCLCEQYNGGDFPYTDKGILVQAKPVIYECGPSCSCSSICKNRTSQQGTNYKFEVFRTSNKEWGLRTLDFIEAGTFITEFVGAIVANSDGKQNNQYMFPVTPTFIEGNQVNLKEQLCHNASKRLLEPNHDSGFKIDASKNGNFSRFIRRSSYPNVFAQNVLYDHENTRIPHVILFALENIAPKCELFMGLFSSNVNHVHASFKSFGLRKSNSRTWKNSHANGSSVMKKIRK